MLERCDVDAVFGACRPQLAAWVDETLMRMGLPRIDHLGRRLRNDAEALPDNQAAWGVRRQLRDPKTGLIPEILAEVYAQFHTTVLAGKACLFHMRGLLHTIVERATWRLATARALVLMRERLAWRGETLPEPDDPSAGPEGLALAAEDRQIARCMATALESAMGHLTPVKSEVVRMRVQDPALRYSEIGARLGISAGAARKHFCEARALLLRWLKPGT